MKLYEVLNASDLSKLNTFFSFDVGQVPCDFGSFDGVSGKGASAKSDGLFSDGGKITFDSSDVGNPPDLNNYLVREIVCHELVHISQYRRGFFYRLKMRWWNWTKDYKDRPHELEAYVLGRQYAQAWPQ